MNKWLKIVQQWCAQSLVFPSHCLLCLQMSGRGKPLCKECETRLPWLERACLCCALPLHEKDVICLKCRFNPPAVDTLQALFQYKWPINAFIAQLKYQGRLEFGKLLADHMLQFTPVTPVECIVAMPLHPQRQQERGFNQTLELAIHVAKKIQLPLNRWDCARKKSTLTQASLNAKKRALNVSDKSFCISHYFNAKHVLVIEDVVTTGTTINAFAKALKQAGVRTVEVWSICRTVL